MTTPTNFRDHPLSCRRCFRDRLCSGQPSPGCLPVEPRVGLAAPVKPPGARWGLGLVLSLAIG